MWLATRAMFTIEKLNPFTIVSLALYTFKMQARHNKFGRGAVRCSESVGSHLREIASDVYNN